MHDERAYGCVLRRACFMGARVRGNKRAAYIWADACACSRAQTRRWRRDFDQTSVLGVTNRLRERRILRTYEFAIRENLRTAAAAVLSRLRIILIYIATANRLLL